MRENQILEAPMLNRPGSVAAIPFWRRLRWTLIINFVLLAVVPLMVVVFVILDRANTQATEQVKRQLESIAELKGNQIGLWLEDSRAALKLFLANRLTRAQVLALLVESLSDDGIAETQLIQNPISSALEEMVPDQSLFEEVFVYNNKGLIVASSNAVQVGKLVTLQPYFAGSLSSDVIQTPYYDVSQGRLTMLVTTPLAEAQGGENIGVLAGRLDLSTLGEIMVERTGLDESGETYLISPENNNLVTPSHFESEGYTQDRGAYRSDGINRALAGQNDSDIYQSYRGVSVIGVYRWIPDLQVALLAEVGEAEALALFTQARDFSLIAAMVAAILAAIFGFYSATRLTRPIATLTQVAARLTAGDLDQQAEITQSNEIGTLAAAFNQMTRRMRELVSSLEDRVAARTQRLETVARIGEQLSAILSLDQLASELVNQIKNEFNYYHAHIYLLDTQGEALVVVAGTGEAGLQMKTQGHRIPLIAPTSLVARAARTGNIVRVDNARLAADWLPNPLLPDTYAEIAVPIILEGKVVGVLDVQEDKIAGLDEADASLLRSLANQVAVAIRNARLFEQIETALAEAQAAQERYTQQAWEKTRVTRHNRQYLYVRPGGVPPDEIKQQRLDETYRQSLGQTKPVVLSLDDNGNETNPLAAPIRLNNRVIGALQLHASKDRQAWSANDLALVAGVIDLLAQTAENLRLFDETREQADFERLVSDITQKIRQAPTLELLTKTAAEQLGQVLGVSHSQVKLGITSEEEQFFNAITSPQPQNGDS
jgi:GAF domain-containing protein/HAMP domain-containing protein